MRVLVVALCVLCGWSCQRGSAEVDAGGVVLPPPMTFTGAEDTILYTFVDATGAVRSVQKLSEVPADRRRNVMVVDLGKSPEERRADRYVYFVDLTVKGPDGRYQAALVSRYQAAGPTAAGLEPAPAEFGSSEVVLYTASWCGFCKKIKSHFKQRGVPFRERDVEKTAGADRELQQKAARAGVRVSGVPVTDFKGELVMGFDQARLDELIARHFPGK